jgi:hypothetical protein
VEGTVVCGGGKWKRGATLARDGMFDIYLFVAGYDEAFSHQPILKLVEIY